MSPPATHPPGRGTLAAIGLLAGLITSLASPLVPDLGAQTLEFVTQPQNTPAGQTMLAVRVRAPSPPLGGVSITLSVASGPGALQGSTTHGTPLFSDIATFSNLRIQEAGTYTLLATASGYTSATSTAFQITPGPPDADESEISVSPTSIPADGVTTSTVTVQLRDQFGNDLDTGGETVTL